MNEVIEAPQSLSLTVPVSQALQNGVVPVGAKEEAECWEIDSADMAQLAATQRTVWATQIDNIKALETDFMTPAKTFMTDIKEKCAKWFGPARIDLDAGRSILGEKLLAWDRREQERITKERLEAEAVQRKIRQEADAKIAADRAKAEETERQQREAQRVANEAHQKAIAEGNAVAAKAAAQAAAKANEAAQAAIENSEARAREVQAEAAAKVGAVVVSEVVKIEGSSVKENWVAVLGDTFTERTALIAICQAITAGRTDLLPLISVDTAARGALNKLASSLKEEMRVPGYRAKNIPKIAGDRK